MRPLLLLRPEPGLTASAERARALGLEVFARPLFVVETVAWQPPDPSMFDALLLTSANAVRHAGPGLAALRTLPVHSVGEATAAQARAVGLDVATVGDRDAAALVATLGTDRRLLHLCGADHVDLPDLVTPLIVYRAGAIADPGLPDLAGLVVAVHSPRAGARLAQLGACTRATIAAISSAAAAACGGGWERVETAAEPSDSALLALAARLCDSRQR